MKDNLKNLLELKNQTDDSADLYFYGDIVSDWSGAWQDEDQYPESVKNFLTNANGRTLNVHINSGGGSIFAGIAIYNMLANYDNMVNVYVDGICASIASVIAMAGDTITMRTGSMMMIHKPAYGLIGYVNADVCRKMADELDQFQNAIMQVYDKKRNPKCSLADIEEKVNAETWLTSDDASELFDIEVEEVEAVAKAQSDFLDQLKEHKTDNSELQLAQISPEQSNDKKPYNENLYEILKMEERKNDL